MNGMTAMHGDVIEIDLVGGKAVVLKPATGNEYFVASVEFGVLAAKRIYYDPPFPTLPNGQIDSAPTGVVHVALEGWTRFYPLANIIEVRNIPRRQQPSAAL